jgi:hypothetical protein
MESGNWERGRRSCWLRSLFLWMDLGEGAIRAEKRKSGCIVRDGERVSLVESNRPWVVVETWARLNLNPHPRNARVRHPKAVMALLIDWGIRVVVRDRNWGGVDVDFRAVNGGACWRDAATVRQLFGDGYPGEPR